LGISACASVFRAKCLIRRHLGVAKACDFVPASGAAVTADCALVTALLARVTALLARVTV
jgi:hypothetical protein